MVKENSKYRWVVFSTVLMAYFLIVSQRTAPGLISVQLMNEFQISASLIGILTSAQFFAYAGLQIPIGILSDRFGPNIFLITGTILSGIGTILYSIAPNEYILLLARTMVGVGDATIWINVVLILSQWFKPNEFVRLLGFAGMSGNLGFLLATVPFSAWIALMGWRMPFLTTGIILFLIGILLYIVLVKIPKKTMKDVVRQTSMRIENREKTLNILLRVFSNRQAWATFFCHFGIVGTYVGFIGSWAVPYGMHVYSLTRSEASQLILIGIIGAIIGAPITSWLASRVHSIKRPYAIVHLIVFCCWLAFLFFSGKPPFFMLILLYFFIGCGIGASALTFAIVRGSFAMKEVGVVSGFANTGGFLSAVLLPAIFGKVLDHFQSMDTAVGYQYGFWIPVAFSLAGLIGVLLIKEKEQEIEKGA